MLIDWWEIGDEQNLRINPKELDLLYKIIIKKYRSLYNFTKNLPYSSGSLYTKLKYKGQGITVALLKKILYKLDIPLEKIGNLPIKVGKRKLIEAKFPIEIDPPLGQVLANAFFDGYADDYIMRYSNYDPEIRREFRLSITNAIKGAKVPINKPENIERDIDLPVFIPKLLKSLWRVSTFLGDKCRIPKQFIQLVKQEKKWGWYFLKGAYLDEGTISGGEVLILTGIKNRLLVEDTQKLAKILGLSTKIREKKARKGYYELKLKASSVEKFYKNISNLYFTKVGKWKRVSEILKRQKILKKRLQKIKEDYKKILRVCRKKGKITISEIKKICGLPESTAYFRVNLLVYTQNLEKRNERKNEYICKNEKLPSPLPTINEMRRRFGWR